MNNNRVYKITDKQFNLIVENQKSSPQLQTEMFDAAADGLFKLIKFGFKNGVKLFKYMQGIKVEIDIKNAAGSTLFSYRKKNPLAPLGLSDPQIKRSPEGLETILPKNTILSSDKDNIAFTSGIITYPVKFKFLNLAEKKENQELQYVTWKIMIEVKVFDQGERIILKLIDFSSSDISINSFVKAIENDLTNNNNSKLKERNVEAALLKQMTKIRGGSDDFVIKFLGRDQANRFMQVVEKQFIISVIRPFIQKYNNDRKVGDPELVIPKIEVDVNPKLITGEVKKIINTSDNSSEISTDEIIKAIQEIRDQYNKYENIEGSEEYLKELNSIWEYLHSLLPNQRKK